MNWRHIDYLLVLWSIQNVQKQINKGKLDPPLFATAGQYNAWRYRMEDKLAADAYKNGWLQEDSTEKIGYDAKEDVENPYDPNTELNDDVEYYRKK